MEKLIQDLRFALRSFAKDRSFTAVALITLALGIGASTAVFSAVNPILFESLPYPDAGRIISISDIGRSGSSLAVTFGTYHEVAQRNHSFSALAVFKGWQPTLTGTAVPEQLEGQRVSADYFRVLGVSPLLGQFFTSAEDRPHGENVVVLSAGLWRRSFASDPAIIGKQVVLEGTAYTVRGVMPDGFENVLDPASEVWAPLQYDPTQLNDTDTREWGHHLRMIGRLRDGVTLAQGRSDLAAMAASSLPQFVRPAWASLANGLTVRPLQQDVTAAVRPALLAVLGAVLLLLLIAAINVANLLFARTAQRRTELAVRVALGAGDARLLRQIVTETLLLALAGGTFGLLIAGTGVRVLVRLAPAQLPRVNAIHLDAATFAFAFVVTSLVGLTVGIAPGLVTMRAQPQRGLQQRAGSAAPAHSLVRRSLVITQVALALVLLTSAGLLLRSLNRLFAVDAGFDPANLLTMQVHDVHRGGDAVMERRFEDVLEAVRHLPGVTSAAFTSQLPISGDLDAYGAQFDNDAPGSAIPVFRYSVSPGYLKTLGIPLLSGRPIDEHDTAAAPHVALVSQSLARRKFGAVDPIGHHLRIGGPANAPPFTIVGVVGNVQQTSLAATNDSDAVYTAVAQWRWTDLAISFVVRSSQDSSVLVPAMERAIWSVDKDQPISRVATMQTLLDSSATERRFALLLFEAFACLALALAAIGIFGVLAGSVTERTREIGVRAALGATPARIVALIGQQCIAMTAIGVAIGLVGSAFATRALTSLLFGISRLDVATYCAVVAVLFAVAMIACFVPARRASRLDPVIALRAE